MPPIKEDDFRELLAQESSDSSQWQRLHGSKDSSFSVFLREVPAAGRSVPRRPAVTRWYAADAGGR